MGLADAVLVGVLPDFELVPQRIERRDKAVAVAVEEDGFFPAFPMS